MIGVLIKAILLIVFNVSFFSITKAACTVSMWVSYAFIHFAFLMFFVSPLLTRNSRNSRHVAIESVTLVTAIYFAITLAAGLFFLFNPLLVVFQYSVDSIITGIYLIALFVTIVVNNTIAKNESELSEDKQFLNNVFVKAEFLKSKLTEQSVSEQLERLQEESRYSPVKSSSSVKDVEGQIISVLDDITSNVENNNMSDVVSKVTNCRDLLKQRNLMLKKGL